MPSHIVVSDVKGVVTINDGSGDITLIDVADYEIRQDDSGNVIEQ